MQEGVKKDKLEIMNIGKFAKGLFCFVFSNKSKEMRQKLEGCVGQEQIF